MRLNGGPAVPSAIDPAGFAAVMASLGPFEPGPAIAVGVSGGPDSMALVLLIDQWVRPRGGSLLALTVDHGLRPGSADEALQVGAWLAQRGIAHEILRWTGSKPATAIQAEARAARYALLIEACTARGILHLAVAHHQDDQAETVLFRRQRGSGQDGLAGMAARRSLGAVELLRPLLGWPKAALVATCQAFAQPFVIDPSNAAPRFARTGLRVRLDEDAGAQEGLLALSQDAGTARARRDLDLAALLGRIAEVTPYGAILLDRRALSETAENLRMAALAAALRAAGGAPYPTEVEAVARLDSALHGDRFRGASLSGCIIRPQGEDRLLIVREAGRIGPPEPLPAGRWHRWDGRFELRLPAPAVPLTVVPLTIGPLTIGPLGRSGYAGLRRRVESRLPSVIAAALPAVFEDGRLVAVPGLGWAEKGAPEVEQRFHPLWPLAAETFTVVYGDVHIICDRGGPETTGDRRF